MRKHIVDEFHQLRIIDFTPYDGGIYFCQQGGDTSSKFNYVVDGE